MTITALHKPSTCAWCHITVDGLEALLDHVDVHFESVCAVESAA